MLPSEQLTLELSENSQSWGLEREEPWVSLHWGVGGAGEGIWAARPHQSLEVARKWISALECCIWAAGLRPAHPLPPHSQRPFSGASCPSVTGLLVNCHTDFVTHGQIIWHFRFLSLANATTLLALVAKKLSETISDWPKSPYGISSWHQQNEHKSPTGAYCYPNEAVSLFMD